MRGPALLMYHWFRDAERPSRSRSPQLEITPQRFEQQMGWLARHGYRTVSLARGLEPAANRRDKTLVLTFDDGTRDFWEHARPVLDRFGFRATLFVVTGFVGRSSEWDHGLGEPARELMSWEQIAQLHEQGHEIGSHGHTHRVFTDLDDASVLDELTRSRRVLAERLGQPPQFFAYPRGFYTARHKRLVQDAGYRGACAVALRWTDLLRSERYELRRVTIKGNESLGRFRLRVGVSRLVRHRESS